MKRILSIILLCALILPTFTGCGAFRKKDITCEDVIAAYEDAGYEVEHIEYSDKRYGWLCEVNVTTDDNNFIYIKFFETDEEAKKYADESQWNAVLWMYSLTMLQPTWVHTERYQNIEIEYDKTSLYRPLKKLMR